MATAPMPSQRPSPVIAAAATPTNANTNPTRAPMSSSSTTGSSGCRASWTYRKSDLDPREWLASRIAVLKEDASSAIETPRTAYATHTRSGTSGWWNLCHPS